MLIESSQAARTAFTTSRAMDFLTTRGLTAECGHSPRHWPRVILKELVDNGLDACEECGIAPVICIVVNEDGISVTDNGPGISPEVVSRVLDLQNRVSSREAYVGPTRGAQGNALKTLVAMPYVLDGEVGRVDITAHGVRHEITLTMDQIRQQPVISHGRQMVDSSVPGTTFRIYWPEKGGTSVPPSLIACTEAFLSSCSILDRAKESCLQLADDYAFLNPHLSISIDWHGDRLVVPARQPSWKKWTASEPAPPHWYDEERFERLIGACIAHDAASESDRTLREFVSEFRGLSGSTKPRQVLEACGIKGAKLSQLACNNEINHELARQLLNVMKRHGKMVKPSSLGILGEKLVAARFGALCDMRTFKYKRIEGEDAGVPWVLEAAFAWDPEGRQRRLITGINWSPCILNPFRDLQG